MNMTLKFSNPAWTEITIKSFPATDDFGTVFVPIADSTVSMNAGVFQVAGQVIEGGEAVIGDYLYIGKVVAVQATDVTFVIDDSANKQYDGFMLKGSWNTSGVYDEAWGGDNVEHAAFTETDEEGVWSVTLQLIPSAGTTWEWGFNDLNGVWLPNGNIQFEVEGSDPVTTTYTFDAVSINDLSKAINVYPNPAESYITISGINVQSAEVYTISGAKVKTIRNSNNVDVSGLNKGMYIMKVVDTEGNVGVSKFNKN
jgi:hypothetical protein